MDVSVRVEDVKSCDVFGRLPSEIRLSIYRHVFRQRVVCNLLIRSEDSIELLSCNSSDTQTSPAVLRTCKTIHSEATPILYSMVDFNIQLTDECTAPRIRKIAPLDATCTFLKYIRHLHVRATMWAAEHEDQAQSWLELLGRALDEANADLQTLTVEIKVWHHQHGIQQRLRDWLDITLAQAVQHQGSHGTTKVWRSMLERAKIVPTI